MKNFLVAIDGPAGSGKSSISQKIANELGFVHMDTGAMYRAVALEALRKKADLNDESSFDFVNDISVIYKDKKVFLNNEDVTDLIRNKEVTKAVSLVASYKIVRDRMLYFQQKSALKGKILMDGRDIGTVVLPNADIKIFLTADPYERAKRRHNEFLQKGINVSFEEVLEDIKKRDFSDENRLNAPLVKAQDAIEVDTTNLNIKEVCDVIIKKINERLK